MTGTKNQFSIVDRFFRPSLAKALCDWLRTEDGWEQTESTNYRYERLLLGKKIIPDCCSQIVDAKTVLSVRNECERAIGRPLSNRYRLMAHRLGHGHYIGVHHDGTHPGAVMNIYVTRSWTRDQGGYLLFMRSLDPSGVDAVIEPRFNRAVVIPAIPGVYHAVSEVFFGQRTALSYFFWLDREQNGGAGTLS